MCLRWQLRLTIQSASGLPLLFGLASYICYTAGLPGDAIFDLKWATVFQGAAVALTAAALYREPARGKGGSRSGGGEGVMNQAM